MTTGLKRIAVETRSEPKLGSLDQGWLLRFAELRVGDPCKRIFRYSARYRCAANQLSKSVVRGCDLARSRNRVGANPIQVAASHGPGIEPCSQWGNSLIDA
jgi:hypothetical protein